jgi:hypothetical protein
MQKISRQVLLKSKVELTRRKKHLLMLVPKQLGSDSATPLERVFEIIEGTVRIGRRYPSDDSKLETAKVADPASSHFYSGPKFQRERITGHNVKIVEGTIRLGRWYPSNDLTLETAKVADSANSRFYSGPKLHRERLEGHKIEATLSVRPKVASRYYECKGIGHFAEECLAQRKWRGKTRNSPGKGNPSERSRLQS